MKSFSYLGYVKVGIEGTEIQLGDATVSDDAQSDDDGFNDLLGKF